MRTKGAIVAALVTVVTWGQACSTREPAQIGALNQCAGEGASLTQTASESSNKEQDDKATVKEQIPDYCKSNSPTWYGNVLPLLNSRIDGQKYQCTTCHGEYKESDLVEREMDSILKSMRKTGTEFMPRIGDRVPDECMDMLRAFKADAELGDPDDLTLANQIEADKDRKRQDDFANGTSDSTGDASPSSLNKEVKPEQGCSATSSSSQGVKQ